ncbi:unnamed protein product [Parajaminaea phylloscopi]
MGIQGRTDKLVDREQREDPPYQLEAQPSTVNVAGIATARDVFGPPHPSMAASAEASTSAQRLERKAVSRLATPAHLHAQFSAPLASRQYARQYAPLYDFRLRKLRKGRLLAKAKARWEDGEQGGAVTHTPRILDVQTGRVTFVIGIIYVEMRLKPDVLQDLTREQYLPPLPPVTSYTDPTTDTVYLEDESGRLCLVGPILAAQAYRGAFVTGTVAAFLGTELENGQFHVQDVCWPGLPRPAANVVSTSKRPKLERDDDTATTSLVGGEADERDDDEYIVLLSGLDMGSSVSHSNPDAEMADLAFAQSEMRLSLLSEWLGGELGDDRQRDRASRIAGVVVAGNLMTTQRADGSTANSAGDGAPNGNGTASTSKAKGGTSNAAKLSKVAMAQANANLTPSPHSLLLSHLLPLSASLPLVLMPGASDPASAAMPQQAIHRAILRGAEKWTGTDEKGPAAGGIHLYNNPAWIQFGNEAEASASHPHVKILASSGQSLDDVMKYIPPAVGDALAEDTSTPSPGPTADESVSERPSGSQSQDERLTAAFRLLSYGHIAPTCPDTLWCFPFTDRDPFIIDEVPDVFVVGNQPQFSTGLWSPATEDDMNNITAGGGGGGVTTSQQPLDSQDSLSSASSSSPPLPSKDVRVVLLPRFSSTGEVALLNTRTKRVEKCSIGWDF